MVEETPATGGKKPYLTLQKLNHLIKGQLRFLLLPDDNVDYNSHNCHSPNSNGQQHSTDNNKAPNLINGDTNVTTTTSSSNKSTNNTNNGYIECEANNKKNSFSFTLNGSGLNGKKSVITSTTDGFVNSTNGSNNKAPSKHSRSNKRSDNLETDFAWIMEVILCDFFMFCTIPISVPLLCINFFLRWIINLYYKVTHQGKIRLMKGEDAFWAFESPANPGNFTSMYIIEGIADLKKIRDKLTSSWIERKNLKGIPMFTKLKLRAVRRAGYFAWEYHDKFDVKEHIRFLHPEDPNKPISEDGLFEEIRDIYDNILPDDKPQWEILVVPNYIYKEQTLGRKKHYAVIFRIHHSIMDGLSAAQALRLVVADNVVEAGIDPMKPIRAPLWQKVLTYILALILLGPYVLRHNYTSRESNAFHGPSLTGPKTLGWSRPMRLDAVKKIKDATHTSVTAVFISCIGGAFRNLALSKGLPVPRKMTAATCAALIPYPNIKAQNRFCVIFTPISAKEKYSFERLKIAQKSFENKFIAAAEVVMAYWITWIGGCFPIPTLNWLQEGICHGTVLLSNLPGPLTTTQIFGGDAIVDIVGWSPIRNRIGIAMCLFGYNGRLRANVIADSSVFPDEGDVSTLIEEFEKEILVLGKALGLREQDCFTENSIGNRHIDNLFKQKYISDDERLPVSQMMHLD